MQRWAAPGRALHRTSPKPFLALMRRIRYELILGRRRAQARAVEHLVGAPCKRAT